MKKKNRFYLSFYNIKLNKSKSKYKINYLNCKIIIMNFFNLIQVLINIIKSFIYKL